MLHFVAFGPWETSRVAQLRDTLAQGDQLVLIEQGALFCAQSPAARNARTMLERQQAHWSVEASALSSANLSAGAAEAAGVDIIDWLTCVALTEQHTPCLSWY